MNREAKDAIVKRAQYYGAEKAVNPDIPLGEYYADLAECCGYDRWVRIPQALRTRLTDAFNLGFRNEQKLNGVI
jgi:hypothetical protein